MRPVFEIAPTSVNPDASILVCEVSNEGFSYVIKDEAENSFSGLAVYHFEKATPPVGYPIALQILFHQVELLSENFKRTIVNYSFPQSVLVPSSLYDTQQSSDILNLVHGDLDNNDKILTDFIPQQSLYNIYRVPAAIYDLVQSQFPNASGSHQYSVLRKQPVPRENQLYVIFYTEKIVASVFKEGRHELVNTFNYLTAADVTYTLLNICRQLELNNVVLHINGLLEQNSLLYKDIEKYFSAVELDVYEASKNYHEEIKKFPSHFFSHLFAIDSCE